jgi:Tol biopolymer transport system component
MLANADGTEQRYLIWTYLSPISGLAWSPDGQTIAWSTGYDGKIVTVSLASVLGTQLKVDVSGRSQQRTLSRRHWFGLEGVSWLSDGNALIVNSSDQNADDPSQLWMVTYPQGEVERITNDLNDYHGVSITSDSTTLVTEQRQSLYSTWVVPQHDVSRAHQISVAAGSVGALKDISWTPDGKLLYASRTGTQMNIGIMDAEGKNRRQLTVDNGNNWMPSASPDGGTIAFVSDRTGHPCVWKMAMDGSNPVQMTHGDHDWLPSISPDGKWIVYVGTVSGRDGIWKVPIEEGPAIYLSDSGLGLRGQLTSTAVSPDARMFTSIDMERKRKEDYENYFLNTKVFAFEGKKLIKVFAGALEKVAWSPDSRSLTYVDTRNGVSNIWSRPLVGDLPEQLTHFTSDRIFSYAWSRDGKQLAVARGTETSDIVLITNFH